jgi:hypothetical protein
MSARLPIFIGAVLGAQLPAADAVFRSVLVPLKAVVLNLLSIGAAYGVLVAVFQWGWLGWLIGIDGGAPIEPWAPMMLFAIVFGLSMDYEVFLLSSVKERVDAGRRNGAAVVEGLASDGAGDHRGRCHHGVRVRHLRPRRPPRDQADRPRPGGRRAARRHRRPHGAGARHDGAARRAQLVAAQHVEPTQPTPVLARELVEVH